MDPFEVFTFHTCSTIARLLFGELVGICGGPRMETGIWRRTPVFMGAQGLEGDPGVCGGNIQMFGGTEQFVGGWQGFGGTSEFEGTRMSEMMLGVFWGVQRELGIGQYTGVSSSRCPLQGSSGPSRAAWGSCCRSGGTAVFGCWTCCPCCG